MQAEACSAVFFMIWQAFIAVAAVVTNVAAEEVRAVRTLLIMCIHVCGILWPGSGGHAQACWDRVWTGHGTAECGQRKKICRRMPSAVYSLRCASPLHMWTGPRSWRGWRTGS